PAFGPINAQESAEGRISGLLTGIDLWKEKPLTGYGPGTFAKASGLGYQAHSLYGQALGELGLVGAASLVWIIIAFWLNARESKRVEIEQILQKTYFPYQISKAVSLCIILLLVMGFGGHNLFRYTWLWVGTFQAVALHCSRQDTRKPSGDQ